MKTQTFINFFKILKIEIKLQLTPIKLIIAFIIAFIPLINPLASAPSDHITIDKTWQYLYRVFLESITYSFFIRLLSILIDKFSQDKNRVEYIIYPSFLILIAKSLVDTFLFIAVILFSLVGSISIIYFLKDGKIPDDFLQSCLSFTIGIIFWYLFVASSLRLIISNNKWKNGTKFALGIIFIIFTFITYITLAISISAIKGNKDVPRLVNGIKYYDYAFPLATFFFKNKWLSFIPFLNVAYISMIMYQLDLESYWLLPIIFQSLLFFILISKPLSRKYKEFLTT